MGSRTRFREKDVEAALRATAGVRTHAAKKLGCSANTIQNYIDRSKKLKEVVAEIDDVNLDIAETVVFKALRDDGSKAQSAKERHEIELIRLDTAKWYLRHRGMRRGYGVRSEVTGKDGGPVQVGGVLAVPAMASPEEWAKLAGVGAAVEDDADHDD